MPFNVASPLAYRLPCTVIVDFNIYIYIYIYIYIEREREREREVQLCVGTATWRYVLSGLLCTEHLTTGDRRKATDNGDGIPPP